MLSLSDVTLLTAELVSFYIRSVTVLETGLYLSSSGQSPCLKQGCTFLCQVNHCVRDSVVSFFVRSISVLETRLYLSLSCQSMCQKQLYLSVLASHCVRNRVVSFAIWPMTGLPIQFVAWPVNELRVLFRNMSSIILS